ncbi:FAD-dependent oxidoreductase [Streptomyces sp. Li-HN-5-11]|uniref:NAD(P)/FAD-dependent oxidoreductase n=1 Tax=Streptomyces sp. Li-HN-5-11 TaxID=3075432 RepID=UPI0028A8C0D7|nr:FAD-dependent oxidoreductase [Streptomyces sp. Li-HN-5-11]WNM35732.1 FAD-dependent oxidoreductase [Streptomyces sp. Li-HN-5-11]
MRRVVIVGASLAATHAIEALRQEGYQGDITLVGAEPHLPYDRPPLSKAALQDGPDTTELLLRPPQWYVEHAVDLRLGQPATALDPGLRRVTLEDGTELPYEGLVIATGSQARSLGPADQGVPVNTLRTLDHCLTLHEQLAPGRHMVVIGGGFIGLEVAATVRRMGLDVSVVEMAPVPLTRVLGDEVGHWFSKYQEGNGVRLHCGSVLDGMEPSSGGTRVRLLDGVSLSADLVVAGVGARPATDWLEGSGLALSDGVLCDSSLRTAAPGVVAAGDIVRWYNPLFDEEMRVEQWSNAVEQGRHAATTLLGTDEPYAPVPYFWSDQFDAKMRFVGRANAADHVHIERSDESSLVALFGRDGVIRGALCVNAPRQLAVYRKAILERIPWGDVVRNDG